MRRPHALTAHGALTLLVILVSTPAARAEEPPVPIGLQAELLLRIAPHDRNLAARAGDAVRTVVLTKGGDAGSAAAAQFKLAAASRPKVGNLPHTVQVVTYTSPVAVAELCEARRVAILYLAPGFTASDATAIARALDGTNVLSASASPELVKQGAVLGFDLVSGRVKVVVDLDRAARQRVAFGADVLALMAVSR